MFDDSLSYPAADRRSTPGVGGGAWGAGLPLQISAKNKNPSGREGAKKFRKNKKGWAKKMAKTKKNWESWKHPAMELWTNCERDYEQTVNKKAKIQTVQVKNGLPFGYRLAYRLASKYWYY